MKVIKDSFEDGKLLFVLTKEEANDIFFALHARIVRLCEIRHDAQIDGDKTAFEYVGRSWYRTLDLLNDWPDFTSEIKDEDS